VRVVRLDVGPRLQVQHLGARPAGTLQVGGDRRTVSPPIEEVQAGVGGDPVQPTLLLLAGSWLCVKVTKMIS
jgi:hypothetical protein